MVRTALLAWLLFSAAADAKVDAQSHPIWSAATQQEVALDELVSQLQQAAWILVGETHDNEVHHQRQTLLLTELQPHLGRAVLALEIFDRDDQDWLDTQPSLAELGERAKQRGWEWSLYRPLVEQARSWAWPLWAVNLSRDAAMRFAREEATLDEATTSSVAAEGREALLQALVDSHCGYLSRERAGGMLQAQQARDATMATALEAARQRLQLPVVLVAGSAHVRRDYGVPRYLDTADIVTLAMIETDEAKPADAAFAVWDFIWPAPPQAREDPCAVFGGRKE